MVWKVAMEISGIHDFTNGLDICVFQVSKKFPKVERAK